MHQVWQSNNARARQACNSHHDVNAALAVQSLWWSGVRCEDPRSTSVRLHGRRAGIGQHRYKLDYYAATSIDLSSVHFVKHISGTV